MQTQTAQPIALFDMLDRKDAESDNDSEDGNSMSREDDDDSKANGHDCFGTLFPLADNELAAELDNHNTTNDDTATAAVAAIALANGNNMDNFTRVRTIKKPRHIQRAITNGNETPKKAIEEKKVPKNNNINSTIEKKDITPFEKKQTLQQMKPETSKNTARKVNDDVTLTADQMQQALDQIDTIANSNVALQQTLSKIIDRFAPAPARKALPPPTRLALPAPRIAKRRHEEEEDEQEQEEQEEEQDADDEDDDEEDDITYTRKDAHRSEILDAVLSHKKSTKNRKHMRLEDDDDDDDEPRKPYGVLKREHAKLIKKAVDERKVTYMADVKQFPEKCNPYNRLNEKMGKMFVYKGLFKSENAKYTKKERDFIAFVSAYCSEIDTDIIEVSETVEASVGFGRVEVIESYIRHHHDYLHEHNPLNCLIDINGDIVKTKLDQLVMAVLFIEKNKEVREANKKAAAIKKAKAKAAEEKEKEVPVKPKTKPKKQEETQEEAEEEEEPKKKVKKQEPKAEEEEAAAEEPKKKTKKQEPEDPDVRIEDDTEQL